MDFVKLEPTARGFDSVLVVVDRRTKYSHFIATRQTVTAEQTAELFQQRIISLHGYLTKIISDRDAKFTSDFWRSIFR